MSFKIDSLLKDKVILYIVLFFAVTNFFGYIMMNNYDAIITMILGGLITSYFSKNMIVILLISIIGGSLVTGASSINEGVKHRLREGMENNTENFKEGAWSAPTFGSSGSGEDDSDKEKAEAKAEASVTQSQLAVKAFEKGKEIGAADQKNEDDKEKFATRPRKKRKNSYKGASEKMDDKMAGLNDAEYAMDRLDKILGGSSVDALMKNQEGLTNAVGALEPLMNKAESMISTLHNSGLIGKLNGMANKMEAKI